MGNSSPIVGAGLACFVWKDGKFLMQQRFGSHGEGTWSVPGGHIEFGETWEECAKREVMEETGMQVTNVRFMSATNDIFTDKGKHYVSIWVEADWLEGEPAITEPDKCKAQQWHDFTTLPSPLFEPCWQNLRQSRPDLFKS
jgi:8-oxo-dGTP diphosphatase